MTSETDKLCRLLDELGVEWEAHAGNGWIFTYWTTQNGAFSYLARENERRYGTGKLLLETTGSTEGALVVTAEQAIAATLGSGTCNPVETEVITYYDEYGHDAVKVHVMECDECGGTYEHINGDYERCPRCGKAVER